MAATTTGNVVAVHDGDTLTMVDSNHRKYRIRLSAIDAPEKNQAFGDIARDRLDSLCLGKASKAVIQNKDRYRRYVAVVFCDGVNVNETLVVEGLAWVYRQYVGTLTHYLDLESAARSAGLGLWIEDDPIPPWQFRRMKKLPENATTCTSAPCPSSR